MPLIHGKQLKDATVKAAKVDETGTLSIITPGASASKGTATGIARVDHVHSVATAAGVGLNSGSVNAEGSASNLARADHTHALDTTNGTQSTVNAGDAAVPGSGTGLALRDHQHAVATAAPGTNLNTSSANGEGSAVNLARSDHSHAFDMALVGDIASVGASKAIGSSGKFADAGHIHDMGSGGSQAVLQTKLMAGQHTFGTFASGTGTSKVLSGADPSGFNTTLGSASVKGSLTTGTGVNGAGRENYTVVLRNATTKDQIDDGAGGNVYAELEENSGTWTLKYYRGDGAAYNFTGSVNLDITILEVFDLYQMNYLAFVRDGVMFADDITASHTHTVSEISDLTATATEINQVTDGVSVNVTAANLNALTGGGDTGLHIHDGRYYTETELGNTVNGSEGASLIGVYSGALTNFSPATDDVQAALEAIDVALGTAGASIPIQENIATQNITGTDTALTALLTQAPDAVAGVRLFLNGVLQEQGATKDYTLGGTGNRTITWLANTGTAVDMETTDVLTAVYDY